MREGEWLVARWWIRHDWGRPYRLETSIQLDEDPPAGPPSAGAALAATLLGAMRRGRRPLLVPGPLDATTQANLPRLQALFAEHWTKLRLRRVPVQTAHPRVPPAPTPSGARVGVFFSGGVDSFFSLLSNLDEIDDLILVRGYDIGLEPDLDGLWKEVVEAGRAVANEFGKRLISVRTNIRPLLLKLRCHWGFSHGAALAHVALLLQPWLRTVYVPASFDIEHVSPWGSHPEIDPLWSTDSLRFIHDGIETNRLQKIHRIAEFPLALQTLRVCNNHPDGAYNCGHCYKCLPTMLALDNAGALTRCATLPHELAPKELYKREKWMLGGCLFLGELRDWWQENEPDSEFLPMVHQILARDGDPDEFRIPVNLD